MRDFHEVVLNVFKGTLDTGMIQLLITHVKIASLVKISKSNPVFFFLWFVEWDFAYSYGDLHKSKTSIVVIYKSAAGHYWMSHLGLADAALRFAWENHKAVFISMDIIM